MDIRLFYSDPTIYIYIHILHAYRAILHALILGESNTLHAYYMLHALILWHAYAPCTNRHKIKYEVCASDYSAATFKDYNRSQFTLSLITGCIKKCPSRRLEKSYNFRCIRINFMILYTIPAPSWQLFCNRSIFWGNRKIATKNEKSTILNFGCFLIHPDITIIVLLNY